MRAYCADGDGPSSGAYSLHREVVMGRELICLAAAVLLTAAAAVAQPQPPVRLCAEWEPAFGTLIRWPLGIPWELVSGLAMEDSLYVLVEDEYQQGQAESEFAQQGVNLDNCRFLQIETYSHWTRDWGPHSAFTGPEREWSIIDPMFDGYPWIPGGPYESYMSGRGFEVDDVVNVHLADEMACPLHQLPAYLTGGNFMTDGHGIAYSSSAMITENQPMWTPEELEQLAEDWLGVESWRFIPNPEEYGIQHIDCCAKLLDESTILLKEVPSWHPDHPRLAAVEDVLSTAMDCYGDPYEIVSVYCEPYSGDALAAYTNSYILNGKVFVPMFGIPADSAALSVYEGAMPGYDVIGVPYGQWYYYDALHCRTREIMDREMLLIWHDPLEGEVPWQESFAVEVMVHDHSGAGLIQDQTGIRWRADGGPGWNWVELDTLPGPDSLGAAIPGQPEGTLVDYYIAAEDYSGREETLPRTAPEGFFQFQVADTAHVADGNRPMAASMRIRPNPTSGPLTVDIRVPDGSEAELVVYDISGRVVAGLDAGALDSAGGTINLDLRRPGGAKLPNGAYIFRLHCGDFSRSEKVVLVE